jgi:outer membrane protein OmpA-like peptidoglycan-associated protein
MNKNRGAYCLVGVLLAGVTTVQAGNVRMYGSDEVPQASEVAEILGGGTVANRPKMRGISLDSVAQPKIKEAPKVEDLAQESNTVVGLPIKFGFNSAEILPENQAQLDAVAEGIKMTSGIRVVVEGHTDAHGSASYNQRLSRERAEAVQRYLVERHGINASLLIVEGLGEKAPLNTADPFAAENRRVQLRAAK